MNTILDRMNLRPQERRFIVVVVVAVFMVGNFLLIWPHFGDWKKSQDELDKARLTFEKYQKETDAKKVTESQARLKELEGAGTTIAASEQSLELAKAIYNYATLANVKINDNSPATILFTTNAYFEEQARKVSLVAEEKDLVNFLLTIGSSNSIIRVRHMVLGPDPTGTRLKGDITLVASYQKNPTQKPPAAPVQAKPGSAAAKTNTVPKTAKPATAANPAAPLIRPNNAPGIKPKDSSPTPGKTPPDLRKNEPAKKS
jgi:hypothetical protein